jgi:soluble lytic murein transglycosylase-like protein
MPLLALLAAGGARAQSVLPQVLSPQDVARYNRILHDERDGHFADAKVLFARLDDKCLEGYVIAEHYLSPHSGRISVHKLVDWLKSYRDLPIADRIYQLAVSRSTRKVRRHHHIIRMAVVTNIPVPSSAHPRGGGYEDLAPAQTSYASAAARTAWTAMDAAIQDDKPDSALAILQGLQAARTATPGDIAHLTQHVAASYLAESMDAKAFDLAGAADSKLAPELDWDAGFAAYRQGHYAQAAAHLEHLAHNDTVSTGLRSRGGFWAARAYLHMGDSDRVIALLNLAAKQKPSFYGLISARLLGLDDAADFHKAVLTRADFAGLMALPAAHRAVALWQIGAQKDVGAELNRAFGEEDPRYDPAMAALARDLGITNVELRASEKSAARGILLKGLFPVPPYRPDNGWRVDASLVLAFARIESRFQAEATSPASARGIMQIMPDTANRLGGTGAADRLYDPGYSLALGQRYIAMLLTRYDGNLLKAGSAYNAGPQAVDRWLNTKECKEDPLLFVESIPVAETRAYVKRLMEYHWLYQRVMNRPSASLDQIATGAWPHYKPAPVPAPLPPPLPAARPAPVPANNTVSFVGQSNDTN